MLDPLEVLEIAIAHERGVTRLARALSTEDHTVNQNVVSAWRMRKIIHPGWLLALRLKYKKQIKQAAEGSACATAVVRGASEDAHG